MAAQLRAVPSRQVAMTPERAKLAELIAERDDLDDRIATARAMAGPAYEAVFEAAQRAEDAGLAVAEAKAAAGRHLIAAAMGHAGDVPMTIEAARAAHVKAVDAHDAVRSAHGALKVETARLEDQLPTMARRVDTAASAVIRLEAAGRARDLIGEVARLEAELTAARREADWLSARGLASRQSAPWVDPRQVPKAAPFAWDAAFAALKSDASARLPLP